MFDPWPFLVFLKVQNAHGHTTTELSGNTHFDLHSYIDLDMVQRHGRISFVFL